MGELKVLVLLLVVTHLLAQAGKCANFAARKPDLAASLCRALPLGCGAGSFSCSVFHFSRW